jgi:DNA-binding GntR family transcriptional regulator
MHQTAQEPKKALADDAKQDVYAVLRRDIVELRLRPGAIVSIRELCEHFSVSRSPMRDALIRLGQEGLIDLMPQRGIGIAKIDLRRVEEERFLRKSVERCVMQSYMEYRKPEDADVLDRSIRRQQRSIDSGNYRKNITLDDEFHKYLYKASGKMFCADVVWKSCGHYSRARLLTCADMDMALGVLHQHEEMTEAVRQGDTDRLLEIFDRHLNKIGTEERALIRKFPELFTQQEMQDEPDDPLRSDFLDTLKI